MGPPPAPRGGARREVACGRQHALAPPAAGARLQRELDAPVGEPPRADPHLGLRHRHQRGVEPAADGDARREVARGRQHALTPAAAGARLQRELDAPVGQPPGADPRLGDISAERGGRLRRSDGQRHAVGDVARNPACLPRRRLLGRSTVDRERDRGPGYRRAAAAARLDNDRPPANGVDRVPAALGAADRGGHDGAHIKAPAVIVGRQRTLRARRRDGQRDAVGDVARNPACLPRRRLLGRDAVDREPDRGPGYRRAATAARLDADRPPTSGADCVPAALGAADRGGHDVARIKAPAVVAGRQRTLRARRRDGQRDAVGDVARNPACLPRRRLLGRDAVDREPDRGPGYRRAATAARLDADRPPTSGADCVPAALGAADRGGHDVARIKAPAVVAGRQRTLRARCPRERARGEHGDDQYRQRQLRLHAGILHLRSGRPAPPRGSRGRGGGGPEAAPSRCAVARSATRG